MTMFEGKKSYLSLVMPIIMFAWLISSGVRSQDTVRNDIEVPHSDYDFLVETINKNIDAINRHRLMESRPFCQSRINDLTENEYRPIRPVYLAESLDNLSSFLVEEHQCEDFSLEEVIYGAGNRKIPFIQEPPFYVYEFMHESEKMFSIFGSGMRASGRAETPELDFEGNPSFMVYEADSCSYAGVSTFSADGIGEHSFSGFLHDSQEDSVVSYSIKIIGDKYVDLQLNTLLSGNRESCGIIVEEEVE